MNWLRIGLAFLFPALGGLLFGYDIGATSGALVSLTSEAFSGVPWYDLTPFQSGLVVSASLFGALVSSVAAFFVGDGLGRRREILLAAVLYALGTALEAGASTYPLLLLGRATYGLGIGFAMHGAPAYIAETAPQEVRGLLISLKEDELTGTNNPATCRIQEGKQILEHFLLTAERVGQVFDSLPYFSLLPGWLQGLCLCTGLKFGATRSGCARHLADELRSRDWIACP